MKNFIPLGAPERIDNKHILFWNEGTGRDGSIEDLKSVDCPVTNCIFTHNKQLLAPVTDYDAIMFNVDSSFDVEELPSDRLRHQVYIMSSTDHPKSQDPLQKFPNNFFNMTFTYRDDSDVQLVPAGFYDTKLQTFVVKSRHIKWRKPEPVRDLKFLKLSKTKSKLATTSSSPCGFKSHRDQLINKLQSYINIDTYGRCGTTQCSAATQENCPQMLNSTYKFYLAIENTNCDNYITENVFVSMQNNIIPIIFNGVTDMQHFLPPNSYINVNDFNSIKKLVKYLKLLDENPQEFANYFWWKKHYKLVMYSRAKGYCDVCMKLNEWSVKFVHQEYIDIGDWFKDSNCKNKTIE